MSDAPAPAPAPAAPLLTGDAPAAPAPAAPAPAAPTNSYPKEDWRHTLPDDIREDASFKTLNDLPSLAKSYLSTKKMVGADKITLPNKHWTKEEWNAFHDRLGRPAVDKYNVNLPKEAKFVSQEWVKELVPIAHEAGLRPEQLEPLLNFYESKVATTQTSVEAEKKAAREADLAELKKEWGQSFDKELSYVRQLVKENADLKEVEYLEKSGLTNDPKLARFLNKIGRTLYKEDSVVQGAATGTSTPAEAQSQINAIMMDSDHAYNNPNHPNHKNAVDEVQKLFKQLHPGEEKGA